MNAVWTWFTVAGLGVFHGLNPAMGWLFAVALGLHRRSAATVVRSLVPIAVGHALAIGAAAGLLAFGLAIDADAVRTAAGIMLVGWGAWLLIFGIRHRARIGMQARFAG